MKGERIEVKKPQLIKELLEKEEDGNVWRGCLKNTSLWLNKQ